MTKELETVILETPNLVFTKKDLGIKQIRNNIIALTVLFTTSVQVLATITPLMKKEIPITVLSTSDFLRIKKRISDTLKMT